MSTISIQEHVIYALSNVQLKFYPYPHFYVRDVWPEDFYWHLQDLLREKTAYKGVEGKYAGRTFGSADDIPELAFMQTAWFAHAVGGIFAKQFKDRYAGAKVTTFADLRLVRDARTYSIGPHTDARWKLISLLFYLPVDGWHAKHGTSLYIPRDPAFRCAGGPHHKFEWFNRVATMPYMPNTCFGFWKTDNSFHGVEPIEEDLRRDVLLYNIYDQEIYSRTHPPTPDA